MACKVIRRLFRFLLWFVVVAASFHSLAKCDIEDRQLNTSAQPYLLEQGLQRIRLTCENVAPQVFYFSRNYISYNQLFDKKMQRVSTLPGAYESYLLPEGNSVFYLDVNSQIAQPFLPSIKSLSEYQRTAITHTFTLSLFIGFCLALTLYVGILGNSMQNYGFYSYSFYVLSAAIFFLLQEGLLYIALPYSTLFSNFKLHLMFAGITVFAAVRFLDQLLDFKALLKKWQRQMLLGLAFSALFVALVQLILPIEQGLRLNTLLSIITLITMAGTISGCVYACIKKVHCSLLVMLGIATMAFTMLFRLVFEELSPFMFRYGLVVGITVEAFIFAIATSRKVKKLDQDRLAAFKRASTDPLCKVLNRSGWESLASNLVRNFKCEGGYLTVLFIDVDDFKEINDQYGHSAGDKILQIIAKVLVNQCRDEDAVGRIGGDEFVIMSHCYSKGQSERLVERVAASLAARDIRTENFVIPVTASVGANITQERSTNLDALLNQADAEMYSVKARRKASSTVLT